MLLVQQRFGFGARTYCKPARDVLDAMTTAATEARRRLIDLTIRELIGVGIWDNCYDALWVNAAADANASFINWRDPANFLGVMAGTPLTLTVDRGYTQSGSAAGYIDLGWKPNTHGVLFQQDSAHIASFSTFTSQGSYFGVGTGSNLVCRLDGGAFGFGRVNTATSVSATGGALSQPLHQLIVRRDASNQRLYQNGAFVANGAQASIALSAANLNIGRFNSGGTGTGRLGVTHVGGAMSDDEIAADYAIWRSFLRGLGAVT